MITIKASSILLSLSLSSVILSSGGNEKVFAGESKKIKDDKTLNVLFFFVDDLRPNLGCYDDNSAVTPNIDRLSQTGLLFTKAYCQQAVCNPSRTSLLTGLRPDEAGVTDLETHFRDKVPFVTTLPQLFKNNGYLTLGTGKVYHSTPFIIDNPSWTRPVPPYEVRGYLLPENHVGTGKQNVAEAADVADTAYPDGVIANTAIKYLEETKVGNKPFFIAVGFTKPHAPFVVPKRYWDIYKDTEFVISDRERPAGSPDLAFHNWEELRGFRDIPKSGPLTPEKEQELWHGYYACISYMDAQVGRVMDMLDKLGLRENTIIILWGDNGYHLGEQDTWCKSTNFELDARIPLIIAAPGMKGNGEKCNTIVESLDVYPTLIDLCDLTPQGKLSGISLQPLLDNPDKRWKNIAFHQFIRPYNALREGKPTH
ncbi:MAG: sulfatase, partial [Bacteroidia bacterium]|nr:sulfatase [Bacteroidia bacterium]